MQFPIIWRKQWTRALVMSGLGAMALAASMGLQTSPPSYVVFGANDLGMHCMQNDFSQMMILPPYNTLHAQVIRRGAEPDIMDGDLTVTYELPGNTHSSDKTNFWVYAQQLLGAPVAADVGISGTPMRGTMTLDPARKDYVAVGMPVTPIEDDGKENPYQLALITVKNSSGAVLTQTQAVVPVSWEMSCNKCHHAEGESTATNILKAHDRLHATTLIASQPVMCASCHSDNALGTAGQPGVPALSTAMHSAHAARMGGGNPDKACYSCHPGARTQCQRDNHAGAGVKCTSCHGSMAAIGNPARNPWVDLPKCGDCHSRAGFEFEQPNTLFRNSKGHAGVMCISCHGSPHAMGAATTETDNAQAVRLQGYAGKIDTCTVCHTSQPSEPFFHKVEH